MPLRTRKPIEPKVGYNELEAALKEGHSSLVDADKVDGLHASELSVISNVEQVETLPSVTMGKIVLFLTDGHIYIGTEVI